MSIEGLACVLMQLIGVTGIGGVALSLTREHEALEIKAVGVTLAMYLGHDVLVVVVSVEQRDQTRD